MKLLIDSNIFIPLEPTGPRDVAKLTPKAVELARLASRGRHQLYVHPTALADIHRDPCDGRRTLRETLFRKYPSLPDPPAIPQWLQEVIGEAEPHTRDWVDDHLLAALQADAVDYLVTEDSRLRRKARRLSLHGRVATVNEAISVLRDLFDEAPLPPPAVRDVKAHFLDETDPIFESFRADYPDFDNWLRKCKLEHRQAWVIPGEDSWLAALCIVKPEESADFLPPGRILKICSFKVSEKHNGFRFGELLLKAIFDYASSNRYDWLYLTVYEKYPNLITLVEDFGFEAVDQRTRLNELILAKPMSPSGVGPECFDPLAFHIRYGPSAVRILGVPAFVVPIIPRYHRELFPEAEDQRQLFPGQQPFGNSIRKAYLCHAPVRKMTPGANLLFYRSRDVRGVTCLGLMEGTLVSAAPNEIARYVGKRTVYSFAEIQLVCQREVLAILFRQARLLRPPISLQELVTNGVLKAAPQSIQAVPEEACEWLRERLDR